MVIMSGTSEASSTTAVNRPISPLKRLESNRFLSSVPSKRLSSLNSKSHEYDDTPVRLTKLVLLFPIILITSSLHLSVSSGGLSKYQYFVPRVCNLTLLAFPFLYGEQCYSFNDIVRVSYFMS